MDMDGQQQQPSDNQQPDSQENRYNPSEWHSLAHWTLLDVLEMLEGVLRRVRGYTQYQRHSLFAIHWTLTVLEDVLRNRRESRDFNVVLFRHFGMVEQLVRVARQPTVDGDWMRWTGADHRTTRNAASILRKFFGVNDPIQYVPPPPVPAMPIIVRIRRE